MFSWDASVDHNFLQSEAWWNGNNYSHYRLRRKPKYKNISFTGLDMDSQDRIQPLKDHYFQNTQIFLFVWGPRAHEDGGKKADQGFPSH